jgi:Xaa-Pro aminopeptidase
MKLTAAGCRERQQRLATVLAEQELDAAIISRRENVYYFTGWMRSRHHGAAALIAADGTTTLIGADDPAGAAVDAVVGYRSNYIATMHSRHHEAVRDALSPLLPAARIGADLSGGVACLTAGRAVSDLTAAVYRLRKRKHADEVVAIRDTIRLTEVAYDVAKAVIRPGIDEVTVFAEVQAAATRAAGELLEDFGNDFQANSIAGRPRRREMKAGELYIIDAGPVLHGYYADNCRTFAVDRQPTDEQLAAWAHIDALFPTIEAAIQPGVRASDVFAIADDHLKWGGFTGMAHHLGHGMGLCPHETPELNPHYDAVFEVGDVFTMEPGLYGADLHAGIRLEENYYLGENGLEQLTSFPRALV